MNGGGTGLAPERAVHLDVSIEQRLSSTLSLQVTGFIRNEANVLWLTGSETRIVEQPHRSGRLHGEVDEYVEW